MMGIKSLKSLSKKSVLVLALVGSTLGLAGCGGNPLLDKGTVSEVRNGMDGYFAFEADASRCASYYEDRAAHPERKDVCDKWSERVFHELKTRHDFIPDNATIEDFRDPKLWMKINPNRKG